MNETALALSIRQPWAELILRGLKTIELRTWDTAYRGPLWLHAGKATTPDLDHQFAVSHPPRGGFVGRFVLTDIVSLDARRWELWRPQHLDPGPYQPGYVAWVLASPQRLRHPVQAPGNLKLFDVGAELLRRLTEALD